MARSFHPGMGQAVAERTILRKKKNKEWESWDDVAHRVALGNSLLCKTKEEQEAEYKILYKHLSKASILMSGRHLQHGDESQPERNMEVFTNCATACTSFALFYLLMNGSGVGRSYDDDIILINWDNAPDVRCVLDDSHADFDYSAHESVRDAKHKYGNGKDVLWHMVDDTREGWAKALELWENAAFEKIHKDKLLILDFSKVRPKGSPIAGMQGRPASGPVPLMNAFMKALTIKNSGLPKFMQSMYIDHYFAECVLVGGARRAARMSTKYWKDPTVFDFITIKRPIEYCNKLVDEIVDLRSSLKIKPNGFLWSSNNSIMVDKEFWELLNLRRKDAGYNSPLAKHARKVFKLATSAAYGDGTGEPGFINVDKLTTKSEGIDKLQNGEILGSKKYQVSDDTNLYLRRLVKKALKKPYYMIVNPCVTKDTWIQTASGPRQVVDLIGVETDLIVNGKPYCSKGFWKTGYKPVYLVKTNRGYSVKATEDHPLLVETNKRQKLNGGYNYDHTWVKVKDLKVGDHLVLANQRGVKWGGKGNFEEGWLLGEIIGDGGFNPEKYCTYLRFWGESKDKMMEYAHDSIVKLKLNKKIDFEGGALNEINDSRTIGCVGLNQLAEQFLEPLSKNLLRTVEEASSEFYRGLLTGLFDADGTVCKNKDKGIGVRLSQSNLPRLYVIQRMLSRLGIASTVYKDRAEAGYKKMPDGDGGEKLYWCQPMHELHVGKDNLLYFNDLIGFKEPDKATALAEAIESVNGRGIYTENFVTKVESIEYIGDEDVYDTTVEDVHEFDANGLRVHNCGEIAIALWGAFCTIGDGVPYHADTIEEAEEAFRAIVRALIRVNTMDSIYHNEVKRTNRIGVGITGVHEFAWKFFKLGFRDLVDENKSREFWATLSRFKRAIQEEAAAYAKKYNVVVPHTDTTIKPAGCRPWDALVTTDSGILNLQELFKDHEDGNTWSEYSGKECAIQDNGVEKPLIRTFYNGKAKVKSIKMRYGLTVTSTLNHPWFIKSRRIGKREEIVNNWVNTEDIKCGDILDIKLGVYQNDKHSEFKKLNTFAIKMNGNCIEIKQPKILNPNLAWFFGYLWGDGAQSPQKYRLRWTEEKINILNKVKNILKEEFGLESTIHECSNKNAFSLEVGNKILWNWLIVNNIWKYQEDRIDFIPKLIRTSSKEDIIAFISGMIDSDGACSVSKGNKNKIYITQKDKSFTNHLQHVCWSVGLGFGCSHNTCGENFQKPRKNMYIMTLGKAVDKEAFNVLLNNSIKLKDAPKNAWHHESKAQNDAIVGMVLSVKDAGEEDTFDVEVADNHWFYAGSVKSHNTNSKLFGLTEGWHLPSMRWYMRWVQFSESDPLVQVYEKNGYPTKHLKQYKNTVIVGFPTTPIITELGMGDAIVTAAEATPEEQYKWISFGEKYWIHGVDEKGVPLVSNTGNQISYTLKYDPKIVDYKGFTKTLKEWQSKVKCCSIMPQEEKSSYEYLPEQPVTKAEYESVMNNIKRVLEEDVDFAHVDCSTGACPVNFNK